MDLKDIQNLIRFVSKSDVTEVKYKEKDFEISIKTSLYNKQQPLNQVFTQAIPSNSIINHNINNDSLDSIIKEDKTQNTDNFVTIKSPMIGTFYRKSGPDKPLLVSEGDVISAGSIICIIEAMKLFNEIEAEISGKIVKILVDDASPIEYDQPLFLVDPS